MPVVSSEEWTIPATAQPDPAALAFALDPVLDAVVQLRAVVPAEAFTASNLGTERHGSAVIIGKGELALTVGYLINEAEQVWLTSRRGTVVPAHVLAYDFATGFGLLRLFDDLGVQPLELGSSGPLEPGSDLLMVAAGGRASALQTSLVAKREFAGYWEYLLEEALFTVPAHPHWGGAACIGPDGRLVGIGSLLIQAEMTAEKAVTGNMVVPIDVLQPILGELSRSGRVDRPARPWLGLHLVEQRGLLTVIGVAPGGPAEKAGLEEGDVIAALGEEPTEDLADFYRQLWALGPAGVTVPLTVVGDGEERLVEVASTDRELMLHMPRRH
ncbi:S1C family serine protease [Geminicoccaceae bacterium 1502E]|nr:S1C family serine protease [Geminicoccaceae bacterium 1502E]